MPGSPRGGGEPGPRGAGRRGPIRHAGCRALRPPQALPRLCLQEDKGTQQGECPWVGLLQGSDEGASRRPGPWHPVSCGHMQCSCHLGGGGCHRLAGWCTHEHECAPSHTAPASILAQHQASDGEGLAAQPAMPALGESRGAVAESSPRPPSGGDVAPAPGAREGGWGRTGRLDLTPTPAHSSRRSTASPEACTMGQCMRVQCLPSWGVAPRPVCPALARSQCRPCAICTSQDSACRVSRAGGGPEAEGHLGAALAAWGTPRRRCLQPLGGRYQSRF